MWSIEFPFDRFPEKLEKSNISRLQKINHFPGSPYLSNKRYFSTTTDSKYVMPSFRLPKDEEKLKNYLKENPESKFVEKFHDNRGVALVPRKIVEEGYKKKHK